MRLDEDEIAARVRDGRLDVARGRAERPDAVIDAGPADLAQMLWHGLSAADADVRIAGNRRAARRFLGLFPAPRPAAA